MHKLDVSIADIQLFQFKLLPHHHIHQILSNSEIFTATEKNRLIWRNLVNKSSPKFYALNFIFIRQTFHPTLVCTLCFVYLCVWRGHNPFIFYRRYHLKHNKPNQWCIQTLNAFEKKWNIIWLTFKFDCT